MPESPSTRRYKRAMGRLMKWASVLASWQLGPRDRGPETLALRDHRESTLVLTAEMAAIVRVLVENRIVTRERLSNFMADEADWLSEHYETRFPGFRANDLGMEATVNERRRR